MLAAEIVKEGVKGIAAGMKPKDLKRAVPWAPHQEFEALISATRTASIRGFGGSTPEAAINALDIR
jgi:hypothetical protein